MIVSEIESLCEICQPTEKIIDVCRDSDDHIILECALESKSNFIITGDDDLLALHSYEEVRIIDSVAFLIFIDDMAHGK
jgi:predicted nucleic acid-binding protein